MSAETKQVGLAGTTPAPWEVVQTNHGTFIKSMQRPGYFVEVRRVRADQAHNADAHLIAAAPDLYTALEPFARFAEMWEEMPLKGVADEFYTIHAGTEWEASISLTACRAARAALAKARGENITAP